MDKHYAALIHEAIPDVSRETFKRLDSYIMLLLKWQNKINLIAPDSVSDLAERHICDSLQLAEYLPSGAANLLDMGSGAGLPGIPLHLVTQIPTTLVESDQRKSAFLTEAKRVLRLSNLTILNSRLESLNGLPSYSVVTARALASLPILIGYAQSFLSKDGFCLFPKGKNYFIELQEAQKQWRFDWQCYPSLTDTEARIIKLWNIKELSI